MATLTLKQLQDIKKHAPLLASRMYEYDQQRDRLLYARGFITSYQETFADSMPLDVLIELFEAYTRLDLRGDI